MVALFYQLDLIYKSTGLYTSKYSDSLDSSWEIVDGSQRIKTIHSFVNNNLSLIRLTTLPALNGYKFNELEEARQGKILNTALRIIVLSEETTDDVKTDMFERVNRGSDLLKPMEKRKGIYTGEFNKFIYEYCDKSNEFKELVKVDKWLLKRQEHEELLLRFFALSDTNVYKKGISSSVSKFLDDYLEDKNTEWKQLDKDELEKKKQEYEERIHSVEPYVKDHFPYGFRHKKNPQTKRAVFEAISIGVWLAIKDKRQLQNLDKEKIEQVLQSPNFIQYTHVATELHKQKKLSGRIQVIYELVTGNEEM